MASETDENKNDKTTKPKNKKSKKFVLRTIKSLRNNCTQGEVFSYIDNLHEQLKKKQKKLKKYKDKIKKLTKSIHDLKLRRAEHKPNQCKETSADPKGAQTGKDDANEVTEPKPPLSLVDEIREAAEAAQNDTGFVYEPTSGLYYDQRTGYYYNAEYGLYYDGSTGCYYKYDQENNKFEFHSQVEIEPTEAEKAAELDDIFDENEPPKESKRQAKRRKLQEKLQEKKLAKSKNTEEREDGELNSSASETDDSVEELKENGQYQDIARKYPPSLRIIVQETNLEKLQEGTLRLITFKGGTLGREGNHDVIIPDLNVSKFHLQFAYDEEKEVYTCVDLGSRNGTILNGKRMSSSKQESEPLELVHGSVVQLSQTKLLCHVHPGNSTCGQCEPGLLMDTKGEASKSVTLSHKQQLKKLQQKYGLENEKFVENRSTAGYNDRAATRRVEVGSSTDKEKTETASIDTEISSENKGFKMLSKLGWSKGTALGKSDAGGLLEPISVNSNDGTKGLGCDEWKPTSVPSKLTKKKMETWKKTQERYNKVSQVNVLSNSDDED